MSTKKTITATTNEKISKEELTADETKKELKVLVTPLITYGIIALGMVGIIVTTALVIEDRITIAGESRHTEIETVATIEIDETTPAIATAQAIESTSPIIETTKVAATEKEAANEVAAVQVSTETAKAKPEADSQIVTTTYKDNTPMFMARAINLGFRSNQTAKARMSQFYDNINKMEQNNIQFINQNKDRQIEVLRKQLSNQSELLEKRIQQLQTVYEQQTASLQKNIERRKLMLNHI